MDLDHEEVVDLEQAWKTTEGDEDAGPGGPPLPKGTYACKLYGCRVDFKNESTGKEYGSPRYQISFQVAGKDFRGRFVNVSGPIMTGPSMQILKDTLAKMRVDVPRLTLDDGLTGSGLVDAITHAAVDTKCHVWIHVKPNEEYPNNPRTYVNKHLTDEEIDNLDSDNPAGGGTVRNLRDGDKNDEPF